jgi:NIMA-interacting peptidyl-prolyl cis-trans isomerase 1
VCIRRSLEEAVEKIKQLENRIRNGEESFENVAEAESECSSHKRGGDLGMFKKGRMQAKFESAVWTTSVGDIIGPIITDSGVHLVMRTR